MKQMSELRPKQIIREIGKRWPQAWQQVKSFRAGKGKDLPDWPDWCYIPLAAGYAICTQGTDYDGPVFDEKLGVGVITAAAAWRVSQGVYRFDADLYNSLVTQPLDDNLPREALHRLPEWCVYIKTYPGAAFCGKLFSGFWAHLEKDQNDGREELRLVLMMDDGDNAPIPIHLGDWSLDEGLKRMQAEAEKQAAKHTPGLILPPVDYIGDIAPLVQLVLYLCAENADMPQVRHPAGRVRMSGQVDVPRQERYWTVGERIGSAIRRYRNESGTESGKAYTSDITHASPRPHVRRAHWHHFWAGPRQGKRKLILHWLPPIPVGVDDADGPAVIHKVERE
jgi:hypothetical protein